MQRKAVKKSTKPPFASRGAVIRVHRNAMGLSRKQLEQRAKLSYRTLSNAEKGESVSDDALVNIAEALGLNFELLKYDPRSHPKPGDSRRADVGIHINRPYDALRGQQAYEAFRKSLAAAFDAWGEIVRLYMTPGSTDLYVSLSYRDIHRLCLAFVEGTLKSLDIDRIEIFGQLTEQQKHKLQQEERHSQLIKHIPAKLRRTTQNSSPAAQRRRSNRAEATKSNPRMKLKNLLLQLQADGSTREVAAQEFYQQYAPIIRGFARKIGVKTQDIEDVVQDVMRDFFVSAPRFNYDPQKGRFRAYLRTRVWNVFRERYRRNISISEDVASDDVGIEAAWNDVWESEKLHRALAIVREEYSRQTPQLSKMFLAFEQFALMGSSVNSVAENLDMSVASVRQAKSRVSKSVRTAMQELDEAMG